MSEELNWKRSFWAFGNKVILGFIISLVASFFLIGIWIGFPYGQPQIKYNITTGDYIQISFPDWQVNLFNTISKLCLTLIVVDLISCIAYYFRYLWN